MSQRILSVAAGASLGLAVALRSASRIPVFEGTSEAAEPWVITSIPSLGWIFIAIVLGAGAGGLLPRRVGTPFLFAGMAASAIFVPGVFDVAPFVSAFSGRFLDFVLLACVLAAGARLVRLPRMTANRAAAVVGAVFVVVALKMSSEVGLSGDEPHYLLMVHSIVEDGDLQVLDNYFAEDYRLFYRGKIGPHLASGTPYSIHGVGLPVLLVPGYALFGIHGALLTLVLMGALVAHGSFRLGERLGMSSEAATLAVAAFALTSPGLFLSVSAYPELPAAAVVTLVALRLASTARTSSGVAFGVSVLVGLLPFLHMKFLLLAGVLWLALGYRARSGRARVATLLGAGLTACALVTFFYVTTESFDPTAAYGRQRIFLSGIPVGVLGLLFDQEFGLLVYAPVYLAAFVGWVALVRRHPFFGIVAALVVASVLLPGAAHPLWSGGSSPPARFLFPALPLLVLGIGSLRSWEWKVGIAPWVPTLLILSLCISVFTVSLPGQPLYLNARDGSGQLWTALSSSWDLTRYLPSIVRLDTRSLVWALIGVAVILAGIVVQFRRRSLSLPAVPLLLLVGAWAQDVTGVPHSRVEEGRWVSGFMRQLAAREPEHFVAVPRWQLLETAEVMNRVTLWLRPLRPDGDPRHWWSLPYSIPAGRYRVSGIAPEGWAPCNDFNCFDVDDTRFESGVALARFRARARQLRTPPPRLHFINVRGARPLARRTLSLPDGRRLHSLDDGAYLDRRGFWVKRGARAAFALEPAGELRLGNGGRQNRVRVHSASGSKSFELAPWAQATFIVPREDGVSVFSVESERGFRPSALDPDDPDDRDLGVFLGGPRF